MIGETNNKPLQNDVWIVQMLFAKGILPVVAISVILLHIQIGIYVHNLDYEIKYGILMDLLMLIHSIFIDQKRPLKCSKSKRYLRINIITI